MPFQSQNQTSAVSAGLQTGSNITGGVHKSAWSAGLQTGSNITGGVTSQRGGKGNRQDPISLVV